MRTILSILFLAILYVSVFAQADAVNIKDPNALKLLDKISGEMASYASMEMNFELNLEFPGMEVEVQKGKIIQSGEKYFLDMDIQSIYCDGQSLWLFMKNNKEVQWTNVQEASSGGFMDPKTLMNLYKTGEYAYAITDEVVENGKKITQIEFKPLDKSSPYSKMRLSLYSDNTTLQSMKVFSKDGSRYTLLIKDIIKNKNYPANTFVFDKNAHPGVHVEDLRM